MGIEQIGIRKKILDTIRDTHKKNWETSSLASLQYNKKIRYHRDGLQWLSVSCYYTVYTKKRPVDFLQ